MISDAHRIAVGHGGGRTPAEPLADEAWRRLVGEAEAHRTLGYLAWAVAEGTIAATDEQRATLLDRHASLMRHALVIESDARALVRASGADRLVLFKGVAAAHLDHRDPSVRVFQDVDAFVPAAHVDDVASVLEAMGASRDLPARTVDWDRRFAKDITFVARSGAEVDLHRTLVPGPFGFAIDLEELASDTVSFDLGGTEVRAFGAERRVVVSALALTAGESAPRLAASLDLIGALASSDEDELVRLAERWRIGCLLAEAVAWSAEQLGSGSLPATLVSWAQERPTEAWERRWRRLYRSAGGTNTVTLLGAPLGMECWRDRRDYLRGLVRPDAAYRSARDRSARPREWRTGLRELVRGSRS